MNQKTKNILKKGTVAVATLLVLSTPRLFAQKLSPDKLPIVGPPVVSQLTQKRKSLPKVSVPLLNSKGSIYFTGKVKGISAIEKEITPFVLWTFSGELLTKVYMDPPAIWPKTVDLNIAGLKLRNVPIKVNEEGDFFILRYSIFPALRSMLINFKDNKITLNCDSFPSAITSLASDSVSFSDNRLVLNGEFLVFTLDKKQGGQIEYAAKRLLLCPVIISLAHGESQISRRAFEKIPDLGYVEIRNGVYSLPDSVKFFLELKSTSDSSSISLIDFACRQSNTDSGKVFNVSLGSSLDGFLGILGSDYFIRNQYRLIIDYGKQKMYIIQPWKSVPIY